MPSPMQEAGRSLQKIFPHPLSELPNGVAGAFFEHILKLRFTPENAKHTKFLFFPFSVDKTDPKESDDTARQHALWPVPNLHPRLGRDFDEEAFKVTLFNTLEAIQASLKPEALALLLKSISEEVDQPVRLLSKDDISEVQFDMFTWVALKRMLRYLDSLTIYMNAQTETEDPFLDKQISILVSTLVACLLQYHLVTEA